MVAGERLRKQLSRALWRVYSDNKLYGDKFNVSRGAALSVAAFICHPEYIMHFAKNKGYLSGQLAYLESVVKVMKEHTAGSSPSSYVTTKNSMGSFVEEDEEMKIMRREMRLPRTLSPIRESRERIAMRREAALKRKMITERLMSENSVGSFDEEELEKPSAELLTRMLSPIADRRDCAPVPKKLRTKANEAEERAATAAAAAVVKAKKATPAAAVVKDKIEAEERRASSFLVKSAKAKRELEERAVEAAKVKRELEERAAAVKAKIEAGERRASSFLVKSAKAKKRELEERAATAKTTKEKKKKAAAKATAARETENKKKQQASRRGEQEEDERLGEVLANALLDLGLEDDDDDAASMPSVFDEGVVYITQKRWASKTSSAASPPSRTGNISGSCIITRRRSSNSSDGGEESPLIGRNYTKTVIIPPHPKPVKVALDFS